MHKSTQILTVDFAELAYVYKLVYPLPQLRNRILAAT